MTGGEAMEKKLMLAPSMGCCDLYDFGHQVKFIDEHADFLQTDTEVITYILDYLLRRQNLTLGEAASVIAAPFWSTIAAKTDLADQKKHTYLRTLFPSLLITGPFSIVFGFNGGLMALNDRLKLRSMVVGEKKDMVYIASEETAIRAMEPDAENIWAPAGGEPVIVTVKEGVLL